MDGMVLPILIMIVVLVLYLALIGIAIASYVMTSLSIYTIARRRQIKNPWLAWIPLASMWTLGCIADDYDSRREIKTNWKKAMLVLSIVFIGLYVVFMISYFGFIAAAIMYGQTVAVSIDAYAGVFVVFLVSTIAMSLASVALMGCECVCLFKIFESTIPDKAVKYFLLYLLVPLAGPICLMKCKDMGYSKAPAVEPIHEVE